MNTREDKRARARGEKNGGRNVAGAYRTRPKVRASPVSQGLIYLRFDLSIGIFAHSSGYYSILAIAIKIRPVPREIIKGVRFLFLGFSTSIHGDNKASAAFLIREWNGGGGASSRALRIIYFPRKRHRRSNFRIR